MALAAGLLAFAMGRWWIAALPPILFSAFFAALLNDDLYSKVPEDVQASIMLSLLFATAWTFAGWFARRFGGTQPRASSSRQRTRNRQRAP